MNYFLRNSAGFLIQFASCMTLCLLPYNAEVFRLNRKKVWLVFSILALLSAVLFPLYMRVPWMLLFNSHHIKAYLYMLFFAAVFMVLYFWVVRSE